MVEILPITVDKGAMVFCNAVLILALLSTNGLVSKLLISLLNFSNNNIAFVIPVTKILMRSAMICFASGERKTVNISAQAATKLLSIFFLSDDMLNIAVRSLTRSFLCCASNTERFRLTDYLLSLIQRWL